MTGTTRQNALFAAEQWTRAYEALSNVSFRAYDQDGLRSALINYIRVNYPEEFNDWIGSSEFVIKLDILAWLSQNLSWRTELNARENMLQLADRRESLLQLAHNIAYKANRVNGATGELKITAIKTTELLDDPDGESIERVVWNDPTDPDWLEKWNTIMNSVFSTRTPVGRPLKRYSKDGSSVSSYRLNSLSPAKGNYSFSSTIAGQATQFEIVNVDLNPETGAYKELSPNPANSFHFLHRADGFGLASAGTGYFLPVKQGSISYLDVEVAEPISSRTIDVPAANINNTDVWVTKISSDGQVLENWLLVDSAFGIGVNFNTETLARVFEVLTRPDDKITIRFGDGKFGEIPFGNFRIWFRTSSPVPKFIKTSDIRDRQISIPYASNGRIYSLTCWFELANDMTDAAESESNADIRYRANKVYYSQDRMVNAEDYNSYFLKDSSILKARSFNRTYAGHGSSIPLNDPTGTYSNVRVIGEDGRLYKTYVQDETSIVSDPDSYSPAEIVDDIIQPALVETDKSVLYHNEYPEIPLIEYTWFGVDVDVNDRSRGRFMRDESSPYATPVGDDAPSNDGLRLVGANAIFRLTDYRGAAVRVDYVSGNGTSESGIVLKDLVEDETRVYSVFPAFRQQLTDDERAVILEALNMRRSFGLRWDQEALEWKIILPEDLDTTSDFSLENEGDTTESGLDASWMFRGEYRPLDADQDRWVFYDRGLKICFESDRDVDFFHAGGAIAVDQSTGRAVRDSIKILRDNEARDSLPRRGLTSRFGADPNQGATVFTGDGTKTVFDLMAEVVDEEHLFVTIDSELVSPALWEVLHVPGMDQIEFTTAPASGEFVAVRHEPHSKYLSTRFRSYTGNDVIQSYSLGVSGLYQDNVWMFIDGVRQRSGDDYYVYRTTSLLDTVAVPVPPSNGDLIKILGFYGSGPAFGASRHVGTGSRTTFATFGVTSDVWVFIDGLLTTNWTLSQADPSNYSVVLSAPPANNANIDIIVSLWPDLAKIKRMTITATASQDSLDITSLGVDADDGEKILAWVNGSMAGWSYEGGFIFFDNPLSAGTKVHVTFFDMVGSPEGGFSVVVDGSYPTQPTYLGSEIEWWVESQLSHDDGYANPNGVEITNVDVDTGGDADNPFLFRELVIQDGTDLVLWRRKLELGSEIWDPVSETTSPMATYENLIYSIDAGDSFSPGRMAGDIHYDGSSWLVADADTGNWIVAEDQTAYRKEIGRSSLRFQWNHYAADGGRIDPSVSNVIDVYVLTSGYNRAVRDWARLNRPSDEFPEAETTSSLQTVYSAFEDKRMISDTIVWHAAKYKPLFGSRASAELKAKFIVVRVPGSEVIPDGDLKLRVLSAIDSYFDYTLWDFGETFYFSELSAFIHRTLPTVVQSVVIVPRAGTGNFGRLYQVRCEPDELFISAAGPEDIEIADSLVDSSMKIT